MPLLLVLGIWLGAHPRWLPEPIADALVGSEERRATIREARGLPAERAR